MSKLVSIILLLFLVVSFILFLSFYETDHIEIEECKMGMGDEIFQRYYYSMYHPSNTTKQFEYLKKRLNDYGYKSKTKFTYVTAIGYSIESFGFVSSNIGNWIKLAQFILSSRPEYFKSIIPDEDTIPDLFITTACGYEYKKVSAHIRNGFNEGENVLYIVPSQLKKFGEYGLTSARKVDTVLLCRGLPKFVEMKCPTSFIIDNSTLSEDNKFLSYAKEHSNSSWIYKPDTSTQGKGIFVSSDPNKVLEYAYNLTKVFHVDRYQGKGGVIQEILQEPLLYYENRRFSIRIVFLITSRLPFIGYLSEHNFRMLLASPSNNDNEIEKDSIISNTHYHKNELNSRNPEVFLEFIHRKGLGNEWINKTIPAIGNGIKHILEQEAFEGMGKKQTNFDILGCDIIIDKYMIPWFLECNQCAGFGKNLKTRATIVEEMYYIILHQHYFGKNEIPQYLQHWRPIDYN